MILFFFNSTKNIFIATHYQWLLLKPTTIKLANVLDFNTVLPVQLIFII